jgi:hypothetical protein
MKRRDDCYVAQSGHDEARGRFIPPAKRLWLFVMMLVLLLAVPAAAQYQLSTNYTADTDLDGVTFSITANAAIKVTRLWTDFSPYAMPYSLTVNIRYRPGGVQAVPGQAPYLDPAWINAGSVLVYPTYSGYTEIPLPLNINIPAGQTYGFYIASTNSYYYEMGMTYGWATNTFTDGLITINTGRNHGYGVEGYPLEYSYEGPYQFCGRVVYDILPGYDIAMKQLVAPVAPFLPGYHSLTVRIFNARANKVKTVNLGYRLGTGTPVTVSSVNLPDSLGPGQTYDYTFATPLNLTTAGSYALKTWVTHPNGFYPDSSVINDTLTTTICTAQQSGTFTINPLGSGPNNFTTFNAAVQALACGITTPVTFTVSPGTYTEQVTIPPVPGASATNTITFNGGVNGMNNVILTFATPTLNSATVLLNGADYIAFKNMTIRATGASYGYGVYLTNKADNNTFEDCKIETSITSTSSYHIAMLASSEYDSYSYGDWANYTLVKNCIIRGGYYGVRFNGITYDGDQCLGNTFLNNTVEQFYYYGMYLYYQRYLVVNNNKVYQRTPLTLTAGYGLFIYYAQGGPQVINNDVRVIAQPFRFYYCNYYGVQTPRAKVVNNMFLATHATATQYGMYVYYCRNTDVWFNTTHLTTNGTGYGAYLYGTTGLSNDFRNNMISYNGTTGSGYLLYNNSSAMFSAFDYNAYWSNNTTFTTPFRYNNVNYASFTAMPRTTHNIYSVYGRPYYVSNTDLHSRSHVAFRAGQAITAVTDDFDGQTRITGYPPCIGADEYPTPPPENDMGIVKVRLENANGKWARIENPAAHQVKVVLQNTGLAPNPTSVTVVYKVGSAPTGTTDGVSQTFTPTWSGSTALVTFTQTLSGLTETPAMTVFARCFHTNDQVPGNDVGSATQQIFTSKVHGYEDFTGMVAPDFTHHPGLIDQPWTVGNLNGGAKWQVTATNGIGGSPALEYPGDTQQANDWVFTPGAQLIGGSSYRVSFQMRSVTGQAQTVEVAFGSAPNATSMTTFAVFSNFTNATFMTSKQLGGGMDPYFNTPNTNQAYYVGFRVTSPANRGAVVIDNIKLDDNPSPPPKIGYGLPGAPITQFIDDPSVPIVIVANYKSSGLISRTYQVASTTNIYGTNGDFLWDVETATPWITLTKATPQPTAQGYNFTPPRPRQDQDFTLTVNPSGLAPGVHKGQIVFYGTLFNYDFPPPANGLIATNEPLAVDVELRIVTAGTKAGNPWEEATLTAMSSGNTYRFIGPSGLPLANVQVTGGSIPSMTIRMYPNQLPQNLARMMYVKRYWQITHTGSGWTANITFPYADQEALMINDLWQLRGVRQAVALGQWEDPITGTSSTSNPGMNEVTVFNFNPGNIGGNIALAQSYFMVKQGDAVPNTFALEQNFPNPFNPATNVSFAVAEERSVRLVVYNSLGVEVAELVNEVLIPGRYTVNFDARDLPSGTCVCRMHAGDYSKTIQMVLSK